MMLALLTANGQHPQPGPAAANLFLVQDWIPVPSYYLSINVPSWTLSCELVFYLSFPFIIPRLVSRSSRWLWFLTGAIGIALIATGLIAYWAGQSTHHSGAAVLVAHFYPVLRLAQFVLGIALALLVERGWRCPVPVWLAVLVAVVPLAIAGVVSGRAGGSLVVMDAVTLPVLWLIVASAASAELSGRRLWALTNASSVRLGQWSFGLYLLQYPALVALADLGAHPRMNLLNAVLGVFALTCVSGAVFTLFERPVERVLRRRLTPGSVASATTLVPSETEGRA